MVADDDSRGKFGILDKQLLSGEAQRDFNPDPRIADFVNGEAALEWMIGAYS